MVQALLMTLLLGATLSACALPSLMSTFPSHSALTLLLVRVRVHEVIDDGLAGCLWFFKSAFLIAA